MDFANKELKAHFGFFFLSFGINIFAGIENALYNLALGLIENDVEVSVYSGFLSGNDEQIGDISVFRSHLLPSSLPNGDITVIQQLEQNAPRIVEEITQFVATRQITHLYVCDPLWGIVQPTKAWKCLDLPMVLSLHVLNTIQLLEEAKNIPYTLYTVVSSYLKSEISHLVNLECAKIVPNSIDVSRFSRKVPSNSSSIEPKIFCNARISPEKGTIYLVQAFAEVIKTFPKSELWLCSGEFPFGNQAEYLSEIHHLIDVLDISKYVRFLPNLRWDQIPAIIEQTTIVVLPSLKETFGIAALEAMASAKPLIVTDVGNLPILVRDAAIVVPPKSPEALHKGIIDLLSDEDAMWRLSVRGSTIANQYSNYKVARQLLELMSVKFSPPKLDC